MPGRAEQLRRDRVEGAGQMITQWVIDKLTREKEEAKAKEQQV